MITDHQTNFVYLADTLKKKCPTVFEQLTKYFKRYNIQYDVLQGTKDIWVRDYMPVQVAEDYFVKYQYNPDYLNTPALQKTITDGYALSTSLGLKVNKVNIKLDGGNVVKSKNRVIATTKLIKENKPYKERALLQEIKAQLRIDELLLIPEEPHDIIGHADGMLRWIDEHRVLMNTYPDHNAELETFGYLLRACLRNAGVDMIELPYYPWQNKSDLDATGCYINYLEVGYFIFYPTYHTPRDAQVHEILSQTFKEKIITGIDCRELAPMGGVLNCITWNIYKP
ncbi:MAG: agmatine deiminase family protein [Chitinophagaceae bacterium]|nr:agmatine deiminase family protein [Chitinophagaceae bacterium]